MSKRKETYVFRCPDSTCTLVIRECRDHVKFDLTMSRYGWSRKQDLRDFVKWLKPLVERYEDDPRPIVLPDPTTGQVSVIGGDVNCGWALVYTPSSH